MPISENDVKRLEKDAYEIRKNCLYCIANLGVGHIGGALSIVEILAYLYGYEMKYDVKNPNDSKRDMFILSKGHAGPALYATLALKGFFPFDWLNTLNKGGTMLPSHADKNRTPGVDMSTGSLGQGISVACGAAYAEKLNESDNRIYCIIGDGESAEGQVWESAMFASHYKLDNLIVICDYNKLQIDGSVEEISGIKSADDLKNKWYSFGWDVSVASGHDFKMLDKAFSQSHEKNGKPKMIIADTIKAKGFEALENQVSSHNAKLTLDEVKKFYNGEVVQWLK